jgi:hypothetical protein
MPIRRYMVGLLLHSCPLARVLRLLSVLLIIPISVGAIPQAGKPRAQVHVPRLTEAPKIEDFLDMKPRGETAQKMFKVSGFTQYVPHDGEPAQQQTEAFFGYDDKNFYAVYLCFDTEPKKVRARMARREKIFDDDFVVLDLDTFHDQRRAYQFWSNPLGVQSDNLWTEGGGNDFSWDTVYHTRGQLTDRGYVVWIAVPFESIRFKPSENQTWGIILWRSCPRLNEESTWPKLSPQIEGELPQEADMHGLSNISPGRNIQLVPYAFGRSYRALDTLDPADPHFVSETFDPTAGIDGKMVIKDSFVLDVTANPDFSQVESDEPQITLNRRFEVFFEEKRPFFLENANFFRTPIDLFFTRRIVDPQFGVRLTGKKGPWALGTLFADDEAPGKLAEPSDSLYGKRAKVGVVRLQRDILKQSNIGLIYTDRELGPEYNRVGGVDGRFRLTPAWVLEGQGVTSATRFQDGSTLAGPAYRAELRRAGNRLFYNMEYDDRSPSFLTETGFLADSFVPRPLYRSREISAPPLRTDIRSVRQFVSYQFRPENNRVISWGPTVLLNPIWDHQGTRVDAYSELGMSWEFTGLTYLEVFRVMDQEVLRPKDFAVLTDNRSYSHARNGVYFASQYISPVNFKLEGSRGTGINFLPPAGQAPSLADLTRVDAGIILRPLRPLRVENTYLLERLTDRADGASIFNNHIIRSHWNWQFTREFSLRVIVQYNSVLANQQRTSLETTKNINADFLFTYLLNPWTALYVGYNGNQQNYDLLTNPAGNQLVRSQTFMNDARQFFVKFSYLLRF